jgi:hypothetical protein
MFDPHVPPQVRETRRILLELATGGQRVVAYFAACPQTNKKRPLLADIVAKVVLHW